MTRILLAGVVATIASLAGPAQAGSPLVCGGPGVLARVADMLAQAGRGMVLEAGSVGEESVGSGRVVSCAVRGRILGYHTRADGVQPVDALFVVRYSLELRQNGIFVQILP